MRACRTLRPLSHSRDMRRGFTLIETMLAAALLLLIAGLLAWTTVDVSRLSSSLSTGATLETQARQALDLLARDASGSSSVLASCTTKAGTTYTSNLSSVLILAAPSYDSTGAVIPGSSDLIVYHVVGTQAPYTVNQLVDPATGSSRPAVSDSVVASNVQSVAFLYLCTQNDTGNVVGVQKSFDLQAPVAGTGTGLIEAVCEGGIPVPLGAGLGQVQFVAPTTTPNKPNGTYVFGTAPASTANYIDVLYSVAPANAASVSQVGMDLTISAAVPDPGLPTRTVELVSTAKLLNH